MTSRNIHAVIAFVDLIDSTRNATYLSQSQYVTSLLLPFQEIANALGDGFFEGRFKHIVRGDEVFIIAPVDSCPADESIRLIIEYCLTLKAALYCTEFNQERIKTGRAPFDIGAGIHYGPVVELSEEGQKPRLEGYSINQAKRIEAASRNGHDCRIVLSSSSQRILFEHIPTDTIIISGPPISVEAKGITGNIQISEIEEYFAPVLFKKIKENVSDFETLWPGICDDLIWISPSYCWPSLLMVGWKYWRAHELQDDGLFHALILFINTRGYIKLKFIALFFLASSEFAKKDFPNAFFNFEKAQKIDNQRRVVIPKLLSALTLLKTGFLQEGDRLYDIKREVLKAADELTSFPEQREQILELKALLKL